MSVLHPFDPGHQEINDARLTFRRNLSSLGNPPPFLKTASAAGRRCVLSLENRMSAHGSLSSVVRRICRRKARADEVGGMAPYRCHAFIRNILSVCRRKPETRSELRSCKLRERFINSHLSPRNHQPFLMIRPIIPFIFSAPCDREGNVSDAKADTVGCVLEYWGTCFGIPTLRRQSWVKIGVDMGVRTVCIGCKDSGSWV